MKKIFIVFILLISFNNLVFAYTQKCNPNISKIDQKKYNVICTNVGFIVKEEVSPETYLYGFYNKNAELELDVVYDYIIELNCHSSRYQRFLVINQDDKYALYDTKTKKSTEFVFDKIKSSFAGTPVTIQDGKEFYIQPYKTIFFSTAKGLGIAVATIITLPIAIIAMPIAMIIYGE